MANPKRTMLVDGYQPKKEGTGRGWQGQGKPATPVKPPKLPKTVSAVGKPNK